MRKTHLLAFLACGMGVSLALALLVFHSNSEKDSVDELDCAPIIVYGIRGTSPVPGPGAPAQAIRKQLGSNAELVAAQYPGEQDSLEEYEWSVNAGRENGLAFLNEASGRCPNSRFLIVGFSQGGHVAHLMMKDLEGKQYEQLRSRTWAILIADPLRSPTDPTIEDYVIGGEGKGSGDHIVSSGGPAVHLGSSLTGRVLSLCHAEDSVCNSPPQESNTLQNPHAEGWQEPEAQNKLKSWLDLSLNLS